MTSSAGLGQVHQEQKLLTGEALILPDLAL